MRCVELSKYPVLILIGVHILTSLIFSFQTELLIQTQLTRESAALSPGLLGDFRHVLELAPRLLEELMKVFQNPELYSSSILLG